LDFLQSNEERWSKRRNNHSFGNACQTLKTILQIPMHFAQERRPKYKYYKLQHAGAAGTKKKKQKMCT